MGNMQCPAEDAAHLASVARDICPFPDYNPSPLFFNMLSINSSLHLTNHYKAVQSSLTPKQLEDFNMGLKTTFGREGNVTLGGVGVVALSLAVLFDALAKHVRGEWVSDSGPIPGLFVKDLGGGYPPYVYTISKYLRMVPHIANNPTRMREESKRYENLILTDIETFEEDKKQMADDIVGVNLILGQTFQRNLRLHVQRIINSEEKVNSTQEHQEIEGPDDKDAANVTKTRKKRIPAPELSTIFSLNCNPEEASKDFLREVQKSNNTQEAFKNCKPFNNHIPKTWLHYIARLVWLDVINFPTTDIESITASLLAQKENFDLKANALRKWTE